MDSLTILALKKAEGGGGGGDITVESLSVSQNGTYTATTGKAYSPVTVAVQQTTVSSLSVTENGTYTATAGTAYSPVSVAVPQTTVSSLSVTENGTYTATEGTAYSPVTVNVPSGGGSSYELKYTGSVTVNTTSTSATSVTTISTGVSFKTTPSKYLMICIHDTAGKRNGYFYGILQFIQMKSAWTSETSFSARRFSVKSDGSITAGTTQYGVYASKVYHGGEIDISAKYDATNSGTIDGTYKVDVYFVDYPTGFSPIT